MDKVSDKHQLQVNMPSDRTIPEPKTVLYSASSWFFLILAFLWVTVFFAIPTIYAFKIEPIPPLTELVVSKGVMSFKYEARKGGPLTVLVDTEGVKVEFSCATLSTGSRGCVHYKLEGKTTEITWTWIKPIYFRPYRYPLRIVVDG